MDRALRREACAAELEALGVEALLVTHLPSVRYLSGYTGSNGQVLIATEATRFFTDGRYEEQSRHEVPDMERVLYGGATRFRDVLRTTVAELGIRRVAFEAPFLSYRAYEELAEIAEAVPVRDVVGKLRWRKDPEELALIARAQEMTDAALAAVVPTLREGMTERRVALDLQGAMYDAGADGPAFETIAAFGENAAEPHHEPTDRKLRKGDVIKLDFGARCSGYHADMTRTLALGDPGDELRGVHRLVRAAQEAGRQAVRSGVQGNVVDRAARAVIEEAGYGKAFGHGLGHGVGLEIHEGPTLATTSEDVLPVNAVVTVEPGVYLPGVGGVRIEDMVVVEEDGCRVLPATERELMVL